MALSNLTIQRKLKSMKVKYPLKYFRGLRTLKDVATRVRKIQKNTYEPFKTDKDMKTRKSTYTSRFHKKFPGAKSLPQKAKATGVPLSIIRNVYNRGLAAWKTGHRPGATAQQWGYARVHSFLTMGKTTRTADSDLVRNIPRDKYKKWMSILYA